MSDKIVVFCLVVSTLRFVACAGSDNENVFTDNTRNARNPAPPRAQNIFQSYGYPKPRDLPILNRKIFKGTRVTIREHPYVVSIRRQYSHYIPGTLLTDNLVLTVAHPLNGVSTEELGVVTGENYCDRGTTINPVVFYVIHEDFDPHTLVNDIAMLRTFEDVYYSTNTKPIRLHIKAPSIGAQAFVTGWGRCDFTGQELCLPRSNIFYPKEVHDPMLRTVTFTVTNNSYCNDYAKNQVYLKPGMMCMGPSRLEESMTSCLAVPGAPQVVHGKLTGILSWGLGCGYTFDMPLVYVNMVHYRKWVHHNMQVMQKILQTHIHVLNLARKAYIMQRWMNETKQGSRFFDDIVFGEGRQLQTFETDLDLATLMGKVYDLRDFIYGGKYHQQKKSIYASLRQKYAYITALKANYSSPSLPFLSLKRLHQAGLIYKDGVLSEYSD